MKIGVCRLIGVWKVLIIKIIKRGGVKLRDKFGIPPFSIFDTRGGEWQERKRAWKSYIGARGESREGTLSQSMMMKYPQLYKKLTEGAKKEGITQQEYYERYIPDEEKRKIEEGIFSKGVSMFDPVVSEVCCTWFTPYKQSLIFDCFAGDCYKGLVFNYLGHHFTGIELRPEQVEENEKIVASKGLSAKYICDDGRNVLKHIGEKSQDLLFSCPPYFDLEVYSDREDDASNQRDYSAFIDILDKAYTDAVECLKDNRFAVIVVGDVRAKKGGYYYDFIGDIKRIFKSAGCYLWNEIILVEVTGTAALRANAPMRTRKVIKTHQNILVFYKGDTGRIKEHFAEIDFKDIMSGYEDKQ